MLRKEQGSLCGKKEEGVGRGRGWHLLPLGERLLSPLLYFPPRPNPPYLVRQGDARSLFFVSRKSG